jgi:16S rRNA C967 or C1407 C5-methylase (RsmB/RsmF family)
MLMKQVDIPKLAYDLLLDRATRLEVENAKLRQENRELHEHRAILRLALIKTGGYVISDEAACLVASALELVPEDNPQRPPSETQVLSV